MVVWLEARLNLPAGDFKEAVVADGDNVRLVIKGGQVYKRRFSVPAGRMKGPAYKNETSETARLATWLYYPLQAQVSPNSPRSLLFLACFSSAPMCRLLGSRLRRLLM